MSHIPYSKYRLHAAHMFRRWARSLRLDNYIQVGGRSTQPRGHDQP